MSQIQTEPIDAETQLGNPVPVISQRPVTLPAPERGADLQLRVSMPISGEELPLVIFSHGYGSSMDGYGPLADHWAAHGLVVIQPTHLDSATIGLMADDPRAPLVWRHRIDDLRRVLDQLDRVEAAVPALTDRLDRARVAAAGHSYGATSASALLGARVLGPDGAPGEDMSDSRVRAGVLLCLAGTGGENLTAFAAEAFPFMNPSFATMRTASLLVYGDQDQSQLSSRGPDWWTDGYTLSPGEKTLLTVFGADHALGGIDAPSAGPHVQPERLAQLALVQRMTTAYLRTALEVDDKSWPATTDALAQSPAPAGALQSR